MSYTSIVKNEVSKLDMVETENISELSAIIRNIGQIGENIKISSENASVSRRIFTLIKKIYHFNPKIVVRRGYNFNKNYIYIIEINQKIDLIKRDLSLDQEIPKEYILSLIHIYTETIVGKIDELMSILSVSYTHLLLKNQNHMPNYQEYF